MQKRAILAKDYEKRGIKKEVQLFEDGLRANTEKSGSYEWWYFDAKLVGGGNLVIVFFSKPMTMMAGGFAPYVSFDLTFPDGKGDIHREFRVDGDDYSFSKTSCDIRIGKCTCKGDLQNYTLYYNDGVLESTFTLKASVPSWRPYAGQIVFGDKNYFAWLPSVPEGQVSVDVTMNGETKSYQGTGYHDHNWGDKMMFFLMHHWYWGRVKVGDYVIVSAYITANKKYNFDETPVFMIAKDGKILADDAERCLTYEESDYEFNEVTKKHLAKTIVYDYKDGATRYRITYRKESDVEKTTMDSQVTKLQYALIWLMGLRGSYHRVGGTVTLERYEGETLVEKLQAPAMWEQMYFGKDKLRNK